MSTADGAGDAGDNDPEVWKLRLYIRGQTPKSARALDNLTKLCAVHLNGRHEIEVIDLAEHPSLARSDDILAVPTLVRYLPDPIRKVIGDLSNTKSVLVGLRLATEAP